MWLIISTIVFAGALLYIVALFSLRIVEGDRRVLSSTRESLDVWAWTIKQRFMRLYVASRKFPAVSFLVMRYFIHIGAKSFARFARRLEEGAYHVADLVSHKHRFQRRQSNNQFLHEVTNHKNGLERDEL